MSSVCRLCLRHQFRISFPLRPLIGVRRYTTYTTTSTTTADDDKPYNSFSLRSMVEHLLRTQRPESAEEILKKTDVEGHGVAFSWNLCLKYYAKQGDIGECDRIYQLMKKTGAIPNVNTYVELAHALNTLYTKQRGSTPPKPRRILALVERLEAQNLPDWNQHKGFGVFFNVLYSAAMRARESDPEDLAELIEVTKVMWEKADPFGPDSQLHQDEKLHALFHFLNTLRISPNREDVETAADMLPQLSQFPSILSRRCALRIAEHFPQAILAKQYWKHFSDVPFDQTASELYLLLLSKSNNNAEEALETIFGIKENTRNSIPAKCYLHALLCCLRPPNIDVARILYQQFGNNSENSRDVGLHALLLDVFRRALGYPHIIKTHQPDKIYSIIREIKFPTLLSQRQVDSKKRVILLDRIMDIMDWRFNQSLDNETKEKVRGDMKFALRWREIIRNENSLDEKPLEVDWPEDVRSTRPNSATTSSTQSEIRETPRPAINALGVESPEDVRSPNSATTPSTQSEIRETPRPAINAKALRRRAAVDDKFISRLASQRRLRQSATPLRPNTRSFGTFSRRLQPDAPKKTPFVFDYTKRKRRFRCPVINPEIVGEPKISEPKINEPKFAEYVSSSREDISLDTSWGSPLYTGKERVVIRTDVIDERKAENITKFKRLDEEEGKSGSENGSWKSASRQDPHATRDVEETSFTHNSVQDEFTTSIFWNSDAEEVDTDSNASLPTRKSKKELPPTTSAAWDPFTPMYFLSEARSELEDKEKRMQPLIPPKSVLIRLPETANKNNIKKFGQKVNYGVAELPVIKRKPVVIRLLDEPAQPSNVESEPDTSIVKPPTSLASPTPTPSVESVDETTPNAPRNPEHGTLRSTPTQSSSQQPPTQSSSQQPRVVPTAIDERISSMRERVRSAPSQTGNVSSKDGTCDVLSMSAEDRILLIRGRMDKVLSSKMENFSGNSGARKGEGSRNVQQREARNVAIPMGVSESGPKRLQKENEWTAFKQKGWELIHKAETRSYVGA